ncbi:MAG: Fic family protein [Desulfomicrobium sp.]|nr:Fic family protein [Pseudomonadota bacterium]MBV1710489.1 Fic family protein [Desulfomicrobium sp.]MBU4570097.1 Fic family protein [Pseudomonadota bacterium]MBU4593016.1 Fic family protein [Pseudomonadota bacterium]MBV1720827.1 Fic family protein [Desulfomicrobium sp.]
MDSASGRNQLAGYAFLIEQHGLRVLPNWHRSSVRAAGGLRTEVHGDHVESEYPPSYWPGDGMGDHLEFALKYDGVNLGILAALFEKVPGNEVATWIASKPQGKYARRIWYLYEFLTNTRLPLPDLTSGNYIPVLEQALYYTVPGRRVARQRVIDNQLGGRNFCPVVRRTTKLKAMEDNDLRGRCEEVVAAFRPDLLRRALSYLYTKETRSSFEIEHVKPSASRTEKFIGLLELAENEDFCDKARIIDVQNRIVDPRFQDTDYRNNQNYVGQSISYQKQLVHYICPSPSDLPELMDGLFAAHRIMLNGGLPAVIHAAVVSYGFVFMHPFEDGNGRIHRFLIHNIFFQRGLVPKGIMFPVSAAMLKNPALYDQSLETFSAPVIRLIDYDVDDTGQMTVTSDTKNLYRFIDMTAQAEALYEFVLLTIEHELVEELDFLNSYDNTKQSIQHIIDMPDRLIDLFIQYCLQNSGRLSARKRGSHFDFLTDDELILMEQTVHAGFTRSDVSPKNT